LKRNILPVGIDFYHVITIVVLTIISSIELVSIKKTVFAFELESNKVYDKSLKKEKI
jgi:anaerobic C4-dicarboxylate transporter